MKSKIAYLFLLFALIACSNPTKEDSSGPLWAIKNVNVIPMTREVVLPNQTIIVQDGLIKTVGSSDAVEIPEGTSVVDGAGKYVMPGLFDMHAHFFQEQGEHKNTSESELKVMLANGLTTVRILAGHPDYLQARQNVKTDQWIGPDLFVASPQLVGKWPWPTDFKNFEVVENKAQAREAVRRFKKEGYDEIKITFMVTRDAYDGIIEAAREEQIKVAGHVGPLVKLPAALEAGQQIEHMDEFIDMLLPDTTYNHGQSVSDMNIWRPNAWATVPHLDQSKIPALAQMVKESGIFVTPTNYFFFSSFGETPTDEQYKQKPDYRYIPASILEERWEVKKRYWDNPPPESSLNKYVDTRMKMTYELWKAGVPLMAGSDSPEWFLLTGFSIHGELATFVRCGLSPYAALQTATVNTANYLGVNRGTIEPGKEADLILLEGNPLDDISNTKSIQGVLHKTWYDRTALDKLLEEGLSIAN